MIDFISVPVIAGFTSAAAITIASGQIKGLLGLQIRNSSHIEGLHGTMHLEFPSPRIRLFLVVDKGNLKAFAFTLKSSILLYID